MKKRKKGIIMNVNIYLKNRIKINGRNNERKKKRKEDGRKKEIKEGRNKQTNKR